MPLDTHRIKALCFDVDGTLRNTDDQYMLHFERYIRPFRFLLPGRDSHRFARHFVMWAEGPGNLLFGIPDRLHIDDDLARLSDWLHRHGIGRQNHDFLIIPGVHEMLDALRADYKLAVVSARSKRGTMAFLDHFDLTGFFDAIATAQTTVRTKPKADPILWAASEMGVQPEDCVMIGDTSVDLRAGRAAGAQTVAVLCGFGGREDFEKHDADLVLESTADIISHLQPNPP